MTTLAAVATAALLVPLAVAGAPDVETPPPATEPAPEPEPIPDGPARLVPVEPCRLLDTRDGVGPLPADSIGAIETRDRCGIDAGASAVVVTITAVRPRAAGFATLFAAGSEPPVAPTVNFRPTRVVSNSAVVPLAGDGQFAAHVSAATEIVVDVYAYFVPTAEPVAEGRYVAIEPVRMVDTRASGGRTGDVVVALPDTVPTDATALVTSVSMVDAWEPGYVTVSPVGATRPVAAAVTTDRHTTTRTGTAVVRTAPDGVVVHRSVPAHLTVDVLGYVTGPSAEVGTAGLFVATPPTRLEDTRASYRPIHADGAIEVTGLPAEAGTAVLNVVALDAVEPGFVTAFAARTAVPPVATLTATWREPVSAFTITPRSEAGVAVTASMGVHVTVDTVGHFLGDPLPATSGPLPNEMPALGGLVLVVSDSAFAGIRWNRATDHLRGAWIVSRLESCRRLIGSSCRGREGYAPETAEQTVLTEPGTYDVLVVATGYNDFSWTFSEGFDRIVAAARAKGTKRIVWLTYREDVSYRSPLGASNAITFRTNNLTLEAKVASGEYPEVEIVDWRDYSAGRSDWLTADGVHLTELGAFEAAHFISWTLAELDRRSCPHDIGGTTGPGGWCVVPRR